VWKAFFCREDYTESAERQTEQTRINCETTESHTGSSPLSSSLPASIYRLICLQQM